tara:strand:+ start:687 stop:923 length:237 start_codon:yes stop_codon:yes gene_type:complete
MKKTMKDEKNKTISWQDKRINEINKICKSRPAFAENFIEEVYAIYYETKADSYEEFVKEQEEKRAKYMPQLIKEWRKI